MDAEKLMAALPAGDAELDVEIEAPDDDAGELAGEVFDAIQSGDREKFVDAFLGLLGL